MTKHKRAFTSHVKMMVMTLVLPHANRWFYQREIQLISGIAYTPVRAALIDLEGFGLLNKRTHGNRQYYMVDKDFFLYEEYKNIVLKTTGLGDHLRYRIKRDGEIALAFVYGDFAEGSETTETPIRFCLVGDMKPRALNEALNAAKKLTQKDFDCLHLTARQFAESMKQKDATLKKIMSGKKIFMVGKAETVSALR